jgi:Trk-type K+ transport system membrane component
VIAKYRFIKMIIRPKIIYLFFFILVAHDNHYFRDITFNRSHPNTTFESFLLIFILFLFLSFTWVFFILAVHQNFIATMKKLERYYYCYYIVLDIYLRPDFFFYFSLSISLSLSLLLSRPTYYLQALSKEKHLVHVIVVDFCTTCLSRTLL